MVEITATPWARYSLNLGYFQATAIQDEACRRGCRFENHVVFHTHDLLDQVEEWVDGMERVDVLALSIHTWNRQLTLRLAEAVKKRWPHCVVVIGGNEITNQADAVFAETDAVDFLLHGEGEFTFSDLLKEIMRSSASDTDALKEIPDISFRDTDGTLHTVPSRPRITDLFTLPSLFISAFYDAVATRASRIITKVNRGAPYVWSVPGISNQNVQNVKWLLRELRLFGKKMFLFADWAKKTGKRVQILLIAKRSDAEPDCHRKLQAESQRRGASTRDEVVSGGPEATGECLSGPERADDSGGLPVAYSPAPLKDTDHTKEPVRQNHSVHARSLPEEITSPGPEQDARPVDEGTAVVGRSPARAAWNHVRHDRVTVTALVITVNFVLIALAAPLLTSLAGWGPITPDTKAINPDTGNYPYGAFGGISLNHLLGIEPGTGFDLFARVVYGLRTSLWVGFASAVLSTVIGVVAGLAAGYFGGWVDSFLSRVMDVTLAFPQLLFIIALTPVIQNALQTNEHGGTDEGLRLLVLILNISVFAWAYTARLVRGQVLSLRMREFVDAARIMGAGRRHILFRQLLPNLWAPILISFAFAVPQNITTEAALSYLGVGVVPPNPDWGSLLSDASQVFLQDPAYLFIPGVLFLVLVLALNLLGDGVRDALDSRAKRS
ncbi:ABC transporter permease subunit [Streptomyces sp. NPDC005474]|uniref:ABC transporter permease subunit n=1 Tax=Streptomyces sp. NPDC005474 TaxID=3154878 RepID=UPI003451E5D3